MNQKTSAPYVSYNSFVILLTPYTHGGGAGRDRSLRWFCFLKPWFYMELCDLSVWNILSSWRSKGCYCDLRCSLRTLFLGYVCCYFRFWTITWTAEISICSHCNDSWVVLCCLKCSCLLSYSLLGSCGQIGVFYSFLFLFLLLASNVSLNVCLCVNVFLCNFYTSFCFYQFNSKIPHSLRFV